jgi:hypothetical protein
MCVKDEVSLNPENKQDGSTYSEIQRKTLQGPKFDYDNSFRSIIPYVYYRGFAFVIYD